MNISCTGYPRLRNYQTNGVEVWSEPPPISSVVLNLFKHVAQQRVRGPPAVQLLQCDNCRIYAIQKWKQLKPFKYTTCATINAKAEPVSSEATHVFDWRLQETFAPNSCVSSALVLMWSTPVLASVKGCWRGLLMNLHAPTPFAKIGQGYLRRDLCEGILLHLR